MQQSYCNYCTQEPTAAASSAKTRFIWFLLCLKGDSLFLHSGTNQPGACVGGPAGGQRLICLDPCLKSVCTTQSGNECHQKTKECEGEPGSEERTRGCLWCESEWRGRRWVIQCLAGDLSTRSQRGRLCGKQPVSPGLGWVTRMDRSVRTS